MGLQVVLLLNSAYRFIATALDFPFGSCLGNRISHAFEGATATPDIPLLVTPISCIRVGFANVTRLTQHLQVLNIKFSFWIL